MCSCTLLNQNSSRTISPENSTSLDGKDLSSSGLTGEIALSLAYLTSIQSLDVSNNSLTGPVPEFLTELPSLKFLNLSNNNLAGAIPTVLLERLKSGSLSLSVDNNSNLIEPSNVNVNKDINPCQVGSCKKRRKVLVPVLVLVELITGKTAIIKSSERMHKLQLVGPLIPRGEITTVVDPRLAEYDANSAWKAVEIAMECTLHTSIKKPTMSIVLNELKECLALERAREQTFSSRREEADTRSSNSI